MSANRYLPCLLLLIAYVVISFTSLAHYGGWVLTACFITLALAVRGNQKLRNFSYTIMIFGVVSLGMYYPQYFVQAGGVKFSIFIIPLLQIIMFGMGCELSLKELQTTIRMPKAVLVGIVCHYTLMPLIGFTLASLFNFPKEIAAGGYPCGLLPQWIGIKCDVVPRKG